MSFASMAELSRQSPATTNGENDGIFGWYQYIQDFPGSFALDWLKRLAAPGARVWEPFSGSGTTLVASKMLGFDSSGFDVSPFMVDVASVKVNWTLDPVSLLRSAEQVITEAETLESEPVEPIKGSWAEYDALMGEPAVPYPADKKLEKWISSRALSRSRKLLAAIGRIPDESERKFLRLAAAASLFRASNMTFRPNICYEPRPMLDYPLIAQLFVRSKQMIADYEAVIGTSEAKASVEVGDARSDGPSEADVIFTSPPYPNDMEYVHQTRLELSLLDYVVDRKGLTALKKRTISSSVKLVYRDNEWQKTFGLEIPGVAAIYTPIAETLQGRNWGWNAADMTAQYFGGMRAVTRNWTRRLSPGGLVAVVIGDSAFNSVKVCSDRLLVETAECEGFRAEGIEVFRSRWNTKHDIELRESVVLLRKPTEG